MKPSYWSKGRLRSLAGRADRAELQIAAKVRGSCTHEPLTLAQEVALKRELEAVLAEEGVATPAHEPVSASRAEDDRAVVWGQYLDDYHRTDVQWGIYGTSAALQILATVAARRGDEPADEEEVAAALPLPESRSTWDSRLEKKVKRGNLNNIVKLAAIAEALRLGQSDVAHGMEPPLVAEVIGLAHNNHYWSSRPPGDRLRVNRDHEFPTAIVLYALKRYEFMRRHAMWDKVRPWLAHTVTTTTGLETATMYSLTGLALLPDASREGQVHTALRRIDESLLKWALSQKKEIVLSAPVFNGFAIADGHDYLFLHPELLVALYFLERETFTDARPFVLRVIEALCDNVTTHGAFEGQSRTISTLDQLWAVRLLDKFVTIYEDPDQGPDALRPHWQFVPGRARRRLRAWPVRIGLGVLLIAVCVAGGAFVLGAGALGWGAVIAACVALVFALGAAAILELFKRRPA